MKNRILELICIFIFLASIVLKVNCYAIQNSGTVYLSSDKEKVEIGQEIEITISLKDFKTVAFTSYLYFDTSKFEYIGSSKMNENINVIDNKIVTVWYDVDGGQTKIDGDVVIFKFKAKEAGSATFIIDGEFFSEFDEEAVVDFNEKIIEIEEKETVVNGEIEQSESNSFDSKLSDENNFLENELILEENNILYSNNLETLAIQDTLLYPAFRSDITDYEAEISKDINDLKILAIPENEESDVEIKGIENLKDGENLVKIIVTNGKNSSSKEYKITIYKRNQEEEEQYNKEVIENKKKLEKIYEVQKLSDSDISGELEIIDKSEDSQKSEVGNEKFKMKIFLIFTLIVIAVLIVNYFIRFRKNNNS